MNEYITHNFDEVPLTYTWITYGTIEKVPIDLA